MLWLGDDDSMMAAKADLVACLSYRMHHIHGVLRKKRGVESIGTSLGSKQSHVL